MSFNTLSTVNPQFWAREAEKSLFVENMAMALANTTFTNLVAGEGSQIDRQIINYPASSTYTPGTDLTRTATKSTQETLSISTWYAAMIELDDTEKRQSIIDIASNVMKKMMRDHNNRIEQAVTGQISNATWTLDDGSVGGTAGNNATVNPATVVQFFTQADNNLDAIDAPKGDRVAVLGTHFLNMLKLQQAARWTPDGDMINTRGEFAKPMFGYHIIYSNNLPYSATLTLSTQPTDADTFTIQGVTFTFKNTIGTTAGNLKIASTAALTVTNAVTSINAPETSVATATDVGFNAISAENAFLLRDKRRIVATDNTTNIGIAGYGDIVVKQSMVAAVNVWSSQLQKALFATRGCIAQIVQIPPKVEVLRDPKQFADLIKSLLGYGVSTFADGAREMVYAKINAGTSDWS